MFMRNAGIILLLLVLAFALPAATGCGHVSPEARFTVSVTEGDAPLSVWFTDMSMGDINSWEWDFDNNGVMDSTQQNVGHVYENPGTYSVSLTVSGPGGTSTEVKESFITVYDYGCHADFVADRTLCDGPCLVKFTDLSTGDVVSWAWDLNGNGYIDSTEQNPERWYTEDGNYSITLTITTSDDCTDTMTIDNYIRVTGCFV